MLVLIGDCVFFAACKLRSQAMGWIFSQVWPVGQHSAVVLAANGMQVVPEEQQKLAGRPEGQDSKPAAEH
jgi:hypothetical protein